MYCKGCGAEIAESAQFCEKCGQQQGAAAGGKQKLTAGLLGILLGGLGIHRFYLGYTTIGVIQIVVTIITAGAGALWGFVEGILILVGKIDKDAEGKALVG